MAPCHAASLVTSSLWKIAAPFALVISSAIFRPSSSSMSATTTLAPSPAKIRAMLAPMPEAPPVISATLSANLIGVLLLGSRPSRPHAGGAPALRSSLNDRDLAAQIAGEQALWNEGV